MNGAFAGLFPSAAFSKTPATPLKGTSDLQVKVPLPQSWCAALRRGRKPCATAQEPGSTLKGQRRGAGAKERSARSSRTYLPVPVGKTHTRACRQSVPGTCVCLHGRYS